MTKKNITISALAAVLILSMAALAFAGPGYGNGRGCGGYGQGGAFSQLTPEKQEAAKAVFEKYEPQFNELRTAMWTKHSVLQAMINDGDSNEKKMGKLTAEMVSLRDQMRDLRTTMNEELTKVTGIEISQGYGRGCGGFQQSGDCPRFGSERGYGRGMGRGLN